MPFIIIIAFISLVSLIILHELGHFILARRFGVKVEEFGIGLPPRIWGRKIGETIYSLNAIPFGAFVRLYGEDAPKSDSRSFSSKPIYQRALIVLGGVAAFWIIAAFLLSLVMGFGVRKIVSDEDEGLVDPRVQITAVSPDSPAEKSGIIAGDIINALKLKGGDEEFKITKVNQVQEFIKNNKGKEVTLFVQRGKELFDVSLVPRINPPEGQGAIGIALARTAFFKYPWYRAPFEGVVATINMTGGVVRSWAFVIGSLIEGKRIGAEIMGPVGIFSLFSQIGRLGPIYFIQFVALISVYLAMFNILPIPALDGGKLLFLGIEKIKGKPLSYNTEQKITQAFFFALIALLIWVTIKDITRLF